MAVYPLTLNIGCSQVLLFATNFGSSEYTDLISFQYNCLKGCSAFLCKLLNRMWRTYKKDLFIEKFYLVVY